MHSSNIAAQLVVTMDRAGNVVVSGPIQNKVVSLGMLQEAILAVHHWHLKKAESPVEIAGEEILGKIGRG